MRIGIIFDGPKDGPAIKVYTRLLQRIIPGVEIDVVAKNNKQLMLKSSLEEIEVFLQPDKQEDECDRVLVVWNMLSSSHQKDIDACQQDCATLKKTLASLNAPDNKVFLICVKEEIEDWLLADGAALEAHLTRLKGQPLQTAIADKPDQSDRHQPTRTLERLYRDELSEARPYTRHAHAEQIINAIQNLTKLGNYCPTFRRFVEKATGQSWATLAPELEKV